MQNAYPRRIARAEKLLAQHEEAAEMLRFYIAVAGFQQELVRELYGTPGSDPESLVRYLPRLCGLVSRSGPAPLRVAAASPVTARNIADFWNGDRAATEENQFFVRVLLQPWAEVHRSKIFDTNVDSALTSASATCPFCSSLPVAGVLRGEGEGGKRSLLCSLCGGEWAFRRVLCPACGEENKDRLPIFRSESIPHVRVDGCDSCHHYVKSIDLTVDGLAVPEVDEIAAVVLDVWADENGYAKITTNVLGA